MRETQKTIYVYDTFSSNEASLMGILYVSVIKGSESYSFEYDEQWLKKTGLMLTPDPELLPYSGRQYPSGKNIFGLFADASPDRWGRMLMNKRERILASKEGRKPSKLHDSDYLLGVYDETRMGGIRVKLDRNGPFLSDDKDMAAPPWATLRTLEEASKNDENDTGAWEMVVHDLAVLCGLHAPEASLEKFSSLGSTFLIKRFDRIGEKRVHFASAMTLLGKSDGASAADGSSYLDMAALIKSYGAEPKKDLLELWKRIVFNMAVTNTDDHLRNHAFILTSKGWILSPLYDVNPVPYGDELSLNVNEENNQIDIDLAVQTAVKFGIHESDAENYADGILEIVRNNWRRLASEYRLSRRQIEEMAPAFCACCR